LNWCGLECNETEKEAKDAKVKALRPGSSTQGLGAEAALSGLKGRSQVSWHRFGRLLWWLMLVQDVQRYEAVFRGMKQHSEV
jgi:hypothetical protein